MHGLEDNISLWPQTLPPKQPVGTKGRKMHHPEGKPSMGTWTPMPLPQPSLGFPTNPTVSAILEQGEPKPSLQFLRARNKASQLM